MFAAKLDRVPRQREQTTGPNPTLFLKRDCLWNSAAVSSQIPVKLPYDALACAVQSLLGESTAAAPATLKLPIRVRQLKELVAS
jgi:hypothetical protein